MGGNGADTEKQRERAAAELLVADMDNNNLFIRYLFLFQIIENCFSFSF